MTGVSGATLDYLAQASREPERAQLTERKFCEGLCHQPFWRPVPETARLGEKLCPACKRKLGPRVPVQRSEIRDQRTEIRDQRSVHSVQ